MKLPVHLRAPRARWRKRMAWLFLALVFACTGIGCGCESDRDVDSKSHALTVQQSFVQTLQTIQTEGPILRGHLMRVKGSIGGIREALAVPQKVAVGLKGLSGDLGVAVRLSKALRAIPAIRTPIDKLRKTLDAFKKKVDSAQAKIEQKDSTYLAPIRKRLVYLEQAMERGHEQIANIEQIAKANEQALGYLSAQPNCAALLDAYAKFSQPAADATATAMLQANATIQSIESALQTHLDMSASAWGDIVRFSRTFLNVAGSFNISLGAGLSLRGLLGKLRGIDDILQQEIDLGLFSVSIEDALDAASWIVDKAKSLLDPLLKPIEDLIKIPAIEFPGMGALTSALGSWAPNSPLHQFEMAFRLFKIPAFNRLFTITSDINDYFVSQFCSGPSLALFASLPQSLQKQFYMDGDAVAACPSGSLCSGGQLVPCPAGHYCSEGAQEKCVDLKPTHYCDGAIRKPCPAGYQCLQGQRSSCPDRYTYTRYVGPYKNIKQTITTPWVFCENGVPNDCAALSDGLHYCKVLYDADGSYSKSYKAPCPKGTRCGGGRSYPCDAGYGCGWTARLKCDELGPFLYCDGMALTPCPKGAICDKGAITGYCTRLGSKEYCSYRTPTSVEIPHAIARQEIGAVAVRTPCPEGTSYCEKGVRYDCPAASSQTYCEAGQRRPCSDLADGYRCKVVANIQRKVACKGAELGGAFAFCEGGQLLACSSLDAMYYCAGDATEGYRPILCPKGWACSAGQKRPCPDAHKCERGIASPCPTSEPCNFISKQPTYYEEAGQKRACIDLPSSHYCTSAGCSGDCGSSQSGINRIKTPCPSGSYCAFGIVQGSCADLDHRYYCNQSTLEACPSEHYCSQGKAFACDQLSIYYYCDGSEKKRCPSSKYKCYKGIKTPCPEGSFCLSGWVYSCKSLKGMLTCKEGSYGSCPSGHSCIEGVAYDCSTLSSDYYCKHYSYGSEEYKQHGYRHRLPCPEGSYCENGVAAACKELPATHYCNGNQKKVCPEGFLCIRGELRTCPASKRCSQGQAAACPIGHACSSGNAFPCPDGHFCVDGVPHKEGTVLHGSKAGLYVNLEQKLYHIDTKTGAWTQKGNATWTYTKGMATVGGSIYVVQGSGLYKVDPSNGSYARQGSTNWSDTYDATSIGHHLYITYQNGHLYKVDTTNNGSYTRLSSYAAWKDTSAMASVLGGLFIIQGGSIDSLYEAKTSSHGYTRKGSSGSWNHTQTMTAVGNHLYVVQNGNLYRVSPENGAWTSLSSSCSGTWSSAKVAFSKSGELYIMTVAAYPTSLNWLYHYAHSIYKVSKTDSCSWTWLSSHDTYHSYAYYTYRGTAVD